MSVTLEHLHRFAIKLFFEPGPAVHASAFIPIFHRWIRDRSLDGLLIDVADYTHLSHGPSVLLIGHEGNLAIDVSDQRAGLLYARKRPSNAVFEVRLASTMRTLLNAARLLEDETGLDPKPRFKGDELQFISNDRLAAPPDDATASTVRTGLGPLTRSLYGGAAQEITNLPLGKDRLRLSATSSETVSVDTLLARIA